MNRFSFTKYEGTGNDFVVLTGEAASTFDVRWAPAICDRHFGVGADGVLLVLPPVSPEARGRMRVVNADGSEPEMCGNGLRCVALALAEAPTETFVVDTGAGAKTCALRTEARGASVTVSMGAVRLLETRTLRVGTTAYEAHLVDAGNPHAILFGSVPPEDRARVGAALEVDPVFPNRTNVEFASFGASAIELVVWERGVGFTLACGTGACATAVAAWQLGLRTEPRLQVELPGGPLWIERSVGDQVIMTGPARRVFDGTWSP